MATPRFGDTVLDDPRTQAIVAEALGVQSDPAIASTLPAAAVLPAWVPSRPLPLRPPRRGTETPVVALTRWRRDRDSPERPSRQVG